MRTYICHLCAFNVEKSWSLVMIFFHVSPTTFGRHNGVTPRLKRHTEQRSQSDPGLLKVGDKAFTKIWSCLETQTANKSKSFSTPIRKDRFSFHNTEKHRPPRSASSQSVPLCPLQVPKEEKVKERGEGGKKKKEDLKDHLFVLRIPKESLRRGGNQQEEDCFCLLSPFQCTTDCWAKTRERAVWKTNAWEVGTESLCVFSPFFISCSPQLWLVLEPFLCVLFCLHSSIFDRLPTSFAPRHFFFFPPFCHQLYSGVFIDSSTGACVSVRMIVSFLVSCFG